MIRIRQGARAWGVSGLVRALSSARLVVASFVAAILFGLLIALVPQRPAGGAPAPEALRALGADRVATMWWFHAFVALACAQLAAALVRIGARDVRRLRRPRGPAGERFEVCDGARLASELRRRGYLRLHRDAAASRFVRHPWGLIGATVLHAGLLLAGVGVMLVTVTRSVGLVTIVEGQTVAAGAALADPSRGPVGAPAAVPATLTLERVEARFWETGEPRRYTGVYLLGEGPGSVRLAVATNEPRRLGGVRYHQESRVGYAFFVTLDLPSGQQKVRLDLPQPPSAREPSYLDRTLPDGSVLKARCDVDEAKGGRPVLTLRLVRGGEEAGMVTLTEGDTAMLEDATVSVDLIRRWAVLTIDRSRGYWLLFFSFFVIFFGGVLLYALVPREVTVFKRDDGSVWADWHVPRFALLYASEMEALKRAAAGGDR